MLQAISDLRFQPTAEAVLQSYEPVVGAALREKEGRILESYRKGDLAVAAYLGERGMSRLSTLDEWLECVGELLTTHPDYAATVVREGDHLTIPAKIIPGQLLMAALQYVPRSVMLEVHQQLAPGKIMIPHTQQTLRSPTARYTLTAHLSPCFSVHYNKTVTPLAQQEEAHPSAPLPSLDGAPRVTSSEGRALDGPIGRIIAELDPVDGNPGHYEESWEHILRTRGREESGAPGAGTVRSAVDLEELPLGRQCRVVALADPTAEEGFVIRWATNSWLSTNCNKPSHAEIGRGDEKTATDRQGYLIRTADGVGVRSDTARVAEQLVNGTFFQPLPAYDVLAQLEAYVQMVGAGTLTPAQAVALADSSKLSSLLRPDFERADGVAPSARGLAVSTGCASGTAVFDVDEAAERAGRGEDVVLVVKDLKPVDVPKVANVKAIVCANGGYTSHAAVVSRQYGLPAVNGHGVFAVDPARGEATLAGFAVRAGDALSVNGTTGELYSGRLAVVSHAEDPAVQSLLRWAREFAPGTEVKANADGARPLEAALAAGATGAGLVRTEHLFIGEDLLRLQTAILAVDEATRARAIAELRESQRQVFKALLERAPGATIRLMDPPLDEFLPAREPLAETSFSLRSLAERLSTTEEGLLAALEGIFGPWGPALDAQGLRVTVRQPTLEQAQLASALGVDADEVLRRARRLEPENPMLDVRGVRLVASHPALYRMQLEALLEAAADCAQAGQAVEPDILVPFVVGPAEVKRVKELAEEVAAQVENKRGVRPAYRLSAMIETPAACLRAGELAKVCDGFSFGTNDLTQLTLGLGRDGDTTEQLTRAGLLTTSPFSSLAEETVGQLVDLALERGRAANPGLRVGVCGEALGFKTVRFWSQRKVDYLSVPGSKVQEAIVLLAQAAIIDAFRAGSAPTATMQWN